MPLPCTEWAEVAGQSLTLGPDYCLQSFMSISSYVNTSVWVIIRLPPVFFVSHNIGHSIVHDLYFNVDDRDNVWSQRVGHYADHYHDKSQVYDHDLSGNVNHASNNVAVIKI